jgi:hypothetical protein
MLITNNTTQTYFFGPLVLQGSGTLTVDDTTATSLYLTDDKIADQINTLAAGGQITVSSAAAPFPRPVGTPEILHGDGSPEGLIYAAQGSTYVRRDSMGILQKTTGIHLNTGWTSIVYVAPTIDPWHYVGNAGEPAFQNSWANYGAPYGGARFRKMPDGLVIMDGLIQSGTVGAAAFTLPAGYRPDDGASGAKRIHIFQTAQASAMGESIRIDTGSGQYAQWGIVPTQTPAPTWLSLVGVTFYAAQ